MSITKEKKAGIFSQFGGAATNTGSIEGQIALLTERISQISSHLQQNKKDRAGTFYFWAPNDRLREKSANTYYLIFSGTSMHVLFPISISFICYKMTYQSSPFL